MTKQALPLALVAVGSILGGCSSARVNTASGRPEVSVGNADWKRASVAIASYNLSKGRQLDRANPNELVLYEAVPQTDGTEQVRSKIIYTIARRNDSMIIASHRFLTADLDDESADEAMDQATLELEQQELSEIAQIMAQQIQERAIASPERSQ